MTRKQLIEEIVQEASTKEIEDDAEAVEYLRSLLIRVSDASMDAVGVEEITTEWEKGNPNGHMADGHNSAIAASKDKRKEWTGGR